MQVMLVGFVLLGRSLEERARLRASSDMNELLSLISTQSCLVISPSETDASTGSILSSDSICIEVPTDDIRVGDFVLVFPGETIPVDVSLVNFQMEHHNSHYNFNKIVYGLGLLISLNARNRNFTFISLLIISSKHLFLHCFR
uniref:P-type ATPase A domain-containing protein n=1 Tax=Lactuca sativa TaxID=4236 RepID=A0A9R1X132_LACSA|nr:hypothetical protein LSAT_V11C800429770 [Lactuca sativa]